MMEKSTEDLRIRKTKKAIKDALIDLMSEKKFSKITVSELSARAMINRKTFYRHYESTEDVLTEIENNILSELSEILKNSSQSCLDIGGVLKGIGTLIENKRDLFLKMMNSNPDLFHDGKPKEMLLKTISVSLKNIGGLEDPNAVAILSQYIVSGVLSVYSYWFDSGCTINLNDLTENVRKLSVEGLKGFVTPDKLSVIMTK